MKTEKEKNAWWRVVYADMIAGGNPCKVIDVWHVSPELLKFVRK